MQFEDTDVVEHFWPMARTPKAMDLVLEELSENPGPVIFTLVNDNLCEQLVRGCRLRQVPCISVLDPVIAAVGSFLGVQPTHVVGGQHELDAAYFQRIEAMDWTLSHDDGQRAHELDGSDVVLIGVSRTSKTPTCLYLANRGIKAANVPWVPGIPLPPGLDKLENPLIIGLTNDPKRLVELRKARLSSLQQDEETDYVDFDQVRAEITEAGPPRAEGGARSERNAPIAGGSILPRGKPERDFETLAGETGERGRVGASGPNFGGALLFRPADPCSSRRTMTRRFRPPILERANRRENAPKT